MLSARGGFKIVRFLSLFDDIFTESHTISQKRAVFVHPVTGPQGCDWPTVPTGKTAQGISEKGDCADSDSITLGSGEDQGATLV